jgi:hypothetical protein
VWAILLIVSACASSDGCPGGEVSDPGPARPDLLFGAVERFDGSTYADLEPYEGDVVTPDDDVVVEGQTVEIDRQTKRHGSCRIIDGSPACVAHVSFREGRSADFIYFWPPDEVATAAAASGSFSINSNRYRLEETTLVVEDGLALPLADGFQVQAGCTDGDATPFMALGSARFGATFYIDWETGEVLEAGCNGCE